MPPARLSGPTGTLRVGPRERDTAGHHSPGTQLATLLLGHSHPSGVDTALHTPCFACPAPLEQTHSAEGPEGFAVCVGD